MPLTQAENQGHTGLSTQLWSGKLCGKQWILGLSRPASEKVWDKTLWRREPGPLPAPHFLQGCGCSMDPTPPLLHQQKGQLATRPDVPAPSGSTWTLSPCVWPLVVRKQHSSFPLQTSALPLMGPLPRKGPPENGDAKIKRHGNTLVLPNCKWHPSATLYFCWFSFWSGCRCWKTEKCFLWGAAYRCPAKQSLGSGVGGRMPCNQLIPDHSAPRHKHWMCSLVNSTKTLLCAHVIHIKSRRAGRAQIWN